MIITDKFIVEKKKFTNWTSDLDREIIKEINAKVFIETFIGKLLVIANYFIIRKLVKTTGASFLPNYNSESSKYVVLLTWLVFGAIVLLSLIQLIIKNKAYKNHISLGDDKLNYYKAKLVNRSMRVVFLVLFFIILYQVFFQVTIDGVDIKKTILWWIVIFNVLGIIYLSIIKLKYFLSIDNLNSDLKEIVTLIEQGDFKGSYKKLSINKDEYIMIGGNAFESVYKGLEELISLAEGVDIKRSSSLVSKSELITNVSHDLKTPLTSIINYVDFLKKGNLSAEEKNDYIEILNRKSQTLKVLIEDLKESTEAAGGKIKLECSDINLKDVLEETLMEYKEKIKASSLEFDFTLIRNGEKVDFENNSIKNVYADRNKILRVFQNIISNILKYSLENSKVYIQLEEEESVTFERGYYIRVNFKNICKHEINIKEEELLERFRRGDASRNTEGSGLGLDIAKSLVEVNGGEFKLNIDNDNFIVNIII